MRTERIKNWAESYKQYIYALYLVSKDKRVPILPKIVVVCTVAYALNPFDLIPDFIPIIGHLDDLLLLPLGIWLAIKLIPQNIWIDCQTKAKQQLPKKTLNLWVIIAIIMIWILLAIIFIMVISYFLN